MNDTDTTARWTSDAEIQAHTRAWARGCLPLMAGTELLIRTGRVWPGAPWLEHLSPTRAMIDTRRLLTGSGCWSGGEQRVTRIAASLLGGPPVRLDDDVPGLDAGILRLVLAALAAANGLSVKWPA